MYINTFSNALKYSVQQHLYAGFASPVKKEAAWIEGRLKSLVTFSSGDREVLHNCMR